MRVDSGARCRKCAGELSTTAIGKVQSCRLPRAPCTLYGRVVDNRRRLSEQLSTTARAELSKTAGLGQNYQNNKKRHRAPFPVLGAQSTPPMPCHSRLSRKQAQRKIFRKTMPGRPGRRAQISKLTRRFPIDFQSCRLPRELEVTTHRQWTTRDLTQRGSRDARADFCFSRARIARAHKKAIFH